MLFSSESLESEISVGSVSAMFLAKFSSRCLVFFVTLRLPPLSLLARALKLALALAELAFFDSLVVAGVEVVSLTFADADAAVL